jgi:purine-binding chemotaxis protein CheW
MECFAKPPRPVEKRTCVVIVEIPMAGETRVVGIVVDAVYAVLDIAPTDVEPPPSILNRIRHEFIQGLGKVDGRFVILLKLDAVLAASADVAIPGVAA